MRQGGKDYPDEDTQEESCIVSKQYDGKSFHGTLSGPAYLVVCDHQHRNSHGGGKIQTKKFFFEELGYWIKADPVNPSEQVVINSVHKYDDGTLATYRGKVTIKSVSLIP